MKSKANDQLTGCLLDFPALEICKDDIMKAFSILTECFRNKGKLLVCGNGGSAADAEHMIAELMKGFIEKRRIPRVDFEAIEASGFDEKGVLRSHLQRALPAISLVSHTALGTAFANDESADLVFAQQVYGYGKQGDVLFAISTSGNSANVLHAIKVARVFGLQVIGLTGKSGGAMKDLCHVCIMVPETITFKVQQYHLPVYHCLCAMVEAEFFG